MAEPIVRKFVIDTDESEQNLKELNTQINATSTAVTQGADSLNKVAAAEENVSASSKSLKAQLRELQAQLANTEPDSAKYRELSAAAGELKDKIQDAAQAVGTQAGGAFERVSGSLGLVTSRIASLDFTGAAEASKLLATNISQLKFKDITDGLKGISSGFISIGKALLSNPIFAIGAALVGIIVYWDELSAAFDNATEAEKRQARIAKEINNELEKQSGAIGKQLSQIEALFDAVSNETLAEEERQRALQSLQTLYPDVFANQQIDINNTEALRLAKENLIKTIQAEAKANAARSLLEQEYAKKFANEIKVQEAVIKFGAEAVQEATETARDNQQTLFKETNQSFSDWINGTEGVGAANLELQNNLATIAELEKIVGDTVVVEANKAADAKVKGNDKVNQSNQKTTDKAKQLNDQRIKNEQEVAEAIAQSKEEQYQASLDAEGKELREVSLKYQELRKKAGDNATLLKQLREQEAAEQIAISNKYFDQRIANDLENEQKLNDAKLAADKAYYDALNQLQDEEYAATLSAQDQEELAVMQKYDALYLLAGDNAERQKEITDAQEAELNAIREKYRKEDEANADAKATADKQRAFEVEDAKLQATSDALGAINGLVGAFAKGDEKRAKAAFKIQKAVSIAQATVDTYKGANAIFASAAANPATVLFPAQPFIAAGVAIASGLANVATIAQQQFQGGTSPGASNETAPNLPGDTGGGTQPAQFNPLAASFLQNREEQITPRAYVLASDVASAAETRENVADLARLG
jgi:hypothetical protein